MNDIQEKIKEELHNNDVVLFMKGTAAVPVCGFSRVVVAILHALGLEDPAIHQGIKVFNYWPTIPQLYVKGKFVGGCDIVKEMYENKELINLFKKHGLIS